MLGTEVDHGGEVGHGMGAAKAHGGLERRPRIGSMIGSMGLPGRLGGCRRGIDRTGIFPTMLRFDTVRPPGSRFESLSPNH